MLEFSKSLEIIFYKPKSKSAQDNNNTQIVDNNREPSPFRKELPKLNPGARRRGQVRFKTTQCTHLLS